MTPRTSAEIASLVGGRLSGPADLPVSGVAALQEAQPADLSFLGNPRYRDQVLPSRAGVVLVPADFADVPPAGRAWIVCADPSAAFMKVAQLFAPPPPTFAPGIHPSAVVHPEARIAASAHVGAQAVVEAGAVVGERSVVGALVYVGQDTRLGDDCLLYPNVTIRERCRLGNRVIVHSGTTIGSDGFGYIPNLTGGLHTKIPQVGMVQIDDDVEIGANVAVDRARFGKTWIKRGAKIDNLVQIAHNVVIGELSFVIAQAGIAGSSSLGAGSVLWAQAGVPGHLRIGNRAQVMAQAGVTKDVPDGAVVVGAPAVPAKEFIRDLFNLHRVEKLAQTVRRLEAEVAALRDAAAGRGPA
jgi:UDP-3-O-[3-hydroxymyristoyl] glucosamine N-acyltransferase